jgi:site-specific DNA-methyltransferase (adenine-specific)
MEEKVTIGNAELWHGDCLEVMNSIPDGSVDMILCDLPYGTSACKWDTVIPFEPLWAQYRRIAKRNAAIVLTASQPFTTALIASNMGQFKYCWVWEKSRKTGFLNAKKQPLRTTEDIAVFYESQATYNPQMKRVRERFVSRSGTFTGYGKHEPKSCSNGGVEYPFNIIKIPSESAAHHPTVKPVALMEYMIRTYTNEGETVLDNCMGSGTTGVACANTGRRFIGIEKEVKYFDTAYRRIEDAQRQGLIV